MTREIRWFLVNYLLVNALWFGIGLVWGWALIALSADGSIDGYRGSTAEQVVWWAVAVVIYGPLILGVPLLAVALLAWRAAIHVVGHPRVTAYVLAASIVGVFVVLSLTPDLLTIALFVALPMFAYAAIVRLPPGWSTA